VEEFIKLLTQKGDVVLDPFIGSGSTAVAAFQNERVYIGFDISKEYCNYARKHLSDA
jgi:DNA modification methylase